MMLVLLLALLASTLHAAPSKRSAQEYNYPETGLSEEAQDYNYAGALSEEEQDYNYAGASEQDYNYGK